MATKKPTIKEVVAKVEMLNRVNSTVIQMVETLGLAFKQYIEYKKDTQDFHEYQKEMLEIRKRLMEESNEKKIITK